LNDYKKRVSCWRQNPSLSFTFETFSWLDDKTHRFYGVSWTNLWRNEHATCRANDIKQKCLLGGNPTQKEKKSDLLSFSIIFYFLHFTLFLSFSYISFLLFQHWGQCCCLKCGGIKRILVFFVIFFYKKSMFNLFELPLVFENMSIMYEN